MENRQPSDGFKRPERTLPGNDVPTHSGNDVPTSSESAPRRPSESAPRRLSESAPRRLSESAPRRPSESAPRRLSESAPRRPSGSAMSRTSEIPAGATRRATKTTSFVDVPKQKGGRIFYVPPEYFDDIDVTRGRLPSIVLDNDYDPTEHRKPTRPIKPWMAYENILRMLFGPGMIIMPLAVSQSGMVLGPILVFMITGLLIHTHLLLLKSLNEVCRQMRSPYISYRYGFRLAVLNGPPLFHWFGNNGPVIISLFTILSELGMCTVYVIITAGNLRDIFDVQYSTPCLLGMLIPILVLEFFMKTLARVSYVALTANVIYGIAFIICFATILDQPLNEYTLVKPYLWHIFWSAGAILFTMSAVSTILTLDKALVNPKIMTAPLGVIKVGLLVPTVVSTVFACVAYWSFGPVEENLLRTLPLDELTTTVVLVLFVISVTLSYPIQCHTAVGAIVEVIKHHDPNSSIPEEKIMILRSLCRPVVVLVSFLIAYLLPYQGPFVAFVGNLCTTMLAITFPAMMDLCLRYPSNYGRYDFHLFKDIIIMFIGIITWILELQTDKVILVGGILQELTLSTCETPLTAPPERPKYPCRTVAYLNRKSFSSRGRVFYVPAEYYDPMGLSRGRLPSIIHEDNDYDPLKNRAPTHPIKPWMAYLNLLRALLGPGLLLMPQAISQSGMLLGPIIIISIGAILIHTHLLLLSCLTDVCRTLQVPHISYRYGFRLALLHGPPLFHWLGERGPSIVALFTVLSQLGLCTVFVIIASDSLQDIMDLPYATPCLLAILPLYLIQQFFMRTLLLVSYASHVGHCFSALGLITMTVNYFVFIPEKDYKWFRTDTWRVFWSMGVVFFNMSAVAVVLSLDKALVEPAVMRSKFGVLNVGFISATLISMIFGCIAYWSFGTVEENVLTELPLDDMVTTYCFWFFIIALTLSYPLQCHPAIATIVEVIKHHDPNDVIPDESLQSVKNITRHAFIILSFIVAYFVPHQGPFVAMMGNLCTSMLALTFPAMMDLCLRYPNRYGRYYILLCKDFLLISFGIIIWIFGIYYCGYVIYLWVLMRKIEKESRWAAFERISRMVYHPIEGASTIDIRRTRLPSIRADSEFDPMMHRNPEHPIKLWMAYFNLLRTMCGAGMLGMPLAISQAGIILGPILLFSTGSLLIFTHLMLLNSLNEISRQLKIPYISYRYGFRLAVLHGPPLFHCIGKNGPQIIATFMFLSQLGICTVFVTLTSDSLRDLMDWKTNKPALLTLLFPYLILEFCMKSLWIVSYVSMFGNLLNLIGLIMIFCHIFSAPQGKLITATTDTAAVLFSFGTFLFNLSAVGVILTMDKALKDARKMTDRFGVITIGIFVPTMISVIFGCLGYWSFGTMEENILRSLPFSEISSMVIMGFYLLSVALSYPIQCYPAIAVIIEVIKYHDPLTTPSPKTLKIVESVARPMFVTMSFIVCYFVPFQGPFVAFVGNLCTAMLSLVFPALMDLCLRYPHYYGGINIHLWKDLLIITIGFIAVIFGVIFCSYLIHIRLKTAASPNTHGYY